LKLSLRKRNVHVRIFTERYEIKWAGILLIRRMGDADRSSKRLPKGFSASSPDEPLSASHKKQRASVATFGQLLDLFAEEQAKLDAAAEGAQPDAAAAALHNADANAGALEQPQEATTLRRRRSSVGFSVGSSVADAEAAQQEPNSSSSNNTTAAAATGVRSRRSSHSGPVVHRDTRSPRVTFNGWADLYEATAVAGEEEDRRLLSLSPVRTPTAAEAAAAAAADVTRLASPPLSPAVRMAEAVTPRVSPKQVAVLEMDGTVRPRKIVRRATGLADHLQHDTTAAAAGSNGSSFSSDGAGAGLTGEDIGSVSEHYNTVFRDWLLTVSVLCSCYSLYRLHIRAVSNYLRTALALCVLAAAISLAKARECACS
jgi:hypothetical protein